MVRLMLTLTPVVCVLSAIAFSEAFSYCLQDEKPTQKSRSNSVEGSVDSSTDSEENSQNGPEKNSHKNLYDKVYAIICSIFLTLNLKAGKIRKIKTDTSKENQGIGANMRTFISVLLVMMLMLFVVHCTWVTSNAYSSPSIVLASYSGDG